jgi:SPP1 family predicted phage head-tail adaptor
MIDASLASRLRERVTIEHAERSADDYGGADIAWTDLATVYAAVQPIFGTAREVSVGGQLAAIAGYRVSIRRRDDVDASMRLWWNGRTLTIHSLHETENTLEILAYEEMA